ncbi:achaete-scute complex protein T3-like [Toxorhynchites rutilus septentrionalis]|uniref:achaete-scute complex protein T3-like n=1 Tax=Toxorhynchites rutilus septentrionalis TaxID=329112 RepID=UPI00247A9BE3|nr:achaete-scute complex protein T3-like [Toxorhynchites rutilus septentrionalis]
MAAVARNMALGQNIYLSGASSLVQQTPVNSYRKRPIAPAPVVASAVVGVQQSSLKDRPMISKKYCALPYAVTPQQSASIQRRNARERNRVKQVNNGFANLRQHLPSTVVTALTNGGRGPHKKLSKVDTLKVAVKYIRNLQRVLEEDIENTGETPKLDGQALSPVSYYGSMSESSNSSSPAPSQLSEYSSYGSQSDIAAFKREPYDVYSRTAVTPTQALPSITSFSSSGITSTATYSQPIHHVYRAHHQPGELSPQNTDDEELLDAISWWQQQQ